MRVALMIGRKGSTGFPNKNTVKIFNKHLCEYPIIAAKKTKLISQIFISTNCPKITKITKKYNPVFLKGQNIYQQILLWEKMYIKMHIKK